MLGFIQRSLNLWFVLFVLGLLHRIRKDFMIPNLADLRKQGNIFVDRGTVSNYIIVQSVSRLRSESSLFGGGGSSLNPQGRDQGF